MARTAKRARKRRARPGRQAPVGVWSPDELLEAIRRPSRARKVAFLRDVAILAQGKLAKEFDRGEVA